MYTTNVMNGYQINEKDIATIIRLLKIHQPEGATRESAIKILKSLKGWARDLADTDPEFMELFLEALEEQKKQLEEEEIEEDTDDNEDNSA